MARNMHFCGRESDREIWYVYNPHRKSNLLSIQFDFKDLDFG
jgi:hypothetical protein